MTKKDFLLRRRAMMGAISKSTAYLTFQSDTDFTLAVSSPNWDGSLFYSTDTSNWDEWDGSSIASESGMLYLRGVGNTIITGGTSYSSPKFQFTGASNLRCTGNISTLLDWEMVDNGVEPIMADYCYSFLFYRCTSLTTAPELPATSLGICCYHRMFQGCTSLTAAPELPATSLAIGCYYGLFYGCTSLTTAPELPATILADGCYRELIQGCSNILVSESPSDIYRTPWRIPSRGTINKGVGVWNAASISDTGGEYTGVISINTTYYLANEPV